MQPGRSTLSSSTDSTDTRISTLTNTLNALIAALGIPITIEAPYELTPSLLLALLESITRRRLPVPLPVRRARDAQSKVEAMKIFLGVLESDVLQEDVGLSEIDPRCLAAGEWEEVVFVGELLCWLGKVHGFIEDENVALSTGGTSFSDISSEVEWQQRGRYASTSPSTSMTTRNDSTVLSTHEEDVLPPYDTPSLSELDLFEAPSRIGVYRTSTPPPEPVTSWTPHSTQEAEEPAYIDHDVSVSASDLSRIQDDSQVEPDPDASEDLTSYCACPSPESPLAQRASQKRSTPVRRSGWIEEVDHEAEVRTFFTARRPQDMDRTPRTQSPRIPGSAETNATRTPFVRPAGRVVTRHTSPTQYTLALLNERAKLMADLANLKASSRGDSSGARSRRW